VRWSGHASIGRTAFTIVQEAAQQHPAHHAQHDVGVPRKPLGGTDLLDDPIPDEQTSIEEFAAFVAHRDHDIGVPLGKRWHSQILFTRSKSDLQAT